MARIQKYKIWIFLFAGLLLRFLLLFVDYSFDVNNHISWGQDASRFGLSGFYETRSREVYGSPYPNYPPIAIFLFYPWFPIQQWLFYTFWELNLQFPLFPSQLVTFVEWRGFLAGLFKIPSVLADLGVAWMLYLFAQKLFPRKKRTHIFALLGILLNPLFLYNSALMGQIDSIPILFSLMSIYVLIYNHNLVSGVLLMTVALLVKPTAAIFLLPFVYVLLKKQMYKQIIVSLFAGTTVFIVSFYPFQKGVFNVYYAFSTYYYKILLTQSLQSVSNGLLNFWSIYHPWRSTPADAIFLLGASYSFWGYGITAVILGVLCWVYIKNKTTVFANWYVFGFLSSFAVVLFLNRMHERYYILPLPFLLLCALKFPFMKNSLYFYSVLATINIYILWTVPRIRPLHQILSWEPLQSLMSLAFVFLFIFSFYQVYQASFHAPQNKQQKR